MFEGLQPYQPTGSSEALRHEQACHSGCDSRQTGWKFALENGEPCVCKPNETHGRHANGHDVFNAGAPSPKLETSQDVKNALVKVGILCQ
jgi:hypothetical protein